ncbi:MAG: Hsp20/alpha crystallin family protein [Chromatiales bacterium]|nr:Hsp20/alpha crystallin family protein [Chromatiales bacterium]
MTLVQYQPWNVFDQLQRDAHRMLEPVTAQEAQAWKPRVDIIETSGSFVIRADVPGIDPKTIEVTLDAGALTLHGAREPVAAQEGEIMRRTERTSGTFSRRFSLPETADADNITATGSNGVLEIEIRKLTEVQPKRITVN